VAPGQSDNALVKIQLLVLDVDGVLTDGKLSYGAAGETGKTFHVLDGGVIRRWQAAGGEVVIISGRIQAAVETRARDLGIKYVFQGVADKLPVYESIVERLSIDDENTAVIGDDLIDLTMMKRCGYPIAPANSVADAKRAAKYVTRRSGGDGAVFEAVDRLMRHNTKCTDAKTCEPVIR
jgi:3-deoxy-D-manno-octulosonate 8-phosphate phosphatase (KDO 8-P phosphatase)